MKEPTDVEVDCGEPIKDPNRHFQLRPLAPASPRLTSIDSSAAACEAGGARAKTAASTGK